MCSTRRSTTRAWRKPTLNIPKLYGVGMTEDCKWYILTEYVPGRTLAELMAENPKKHAAYLEQFVDLQLSMHRQICPLLPRLRDKMDRKIIQTELPTATKYDLHTRLESMPRHNKLCHGDFNPTNVILRDDGTPFILDWSHATQGNASADAARTFLLFSLAGDDKTAEAYLKLFCEKSGTPRAVCAEVDSHRRRKPVRQGQAGGTRAALPLGRRGGLRVIEIRILAFSFFSVGYHYGQQTIRYGGISYVRTQQAVCAVSHDGTRDPK